MDPTTLIQTSYGTVPLASVLHAYEQKKKHSAIQSLKQKTPEGKAYSRLKAKEYYQRHKDKVLAKRAARYETDAETLKTRCREYYHTHTEECKDRMKRWKEKKAGRVAEGGPEAAPEN